MRTKKGNLLPAKGNKLPFSEVASRSPVGYARAIADALQSEVISGGASAKSIMRWTGACERTVKGWISGTIGPRGEHLIALMRESDAVLLAVLRLARRDPLRRPPDLETVRTYLTKAILALDEPGPHGDQGNVE